MTYESAGHKIQIDFLMLREAVCCLVTNVEVIVAEECVSQHHIVVKDQTLGGVRRVKK